MPADHDPTMTSGTCAGALPPTRLDGMTSTSAVLPVTTTRSRTKAVLRFAGHYLEMVLAMSVGMVALAPLWRLAWPGLADRPDLETLTMVLDMTVVMAGWMRLRGHGRRSVVRMCVAMDLGFALVLPAYWVGVLDAEAMEMLGHGLMLVLMLVVMLRDRHDEHA
jgi:flagellar biosynthetic protein FliP